MLDTTESFLRGFQRSDWGVIVMKWECANKSYEFIYWIQALLIGDCGLD